MSHISTVAMQIDDLEALADAARACGLELRRNQRTFKTYAGKQTACDAAIVLPGSEAAYEIGVTRAGRKYELNFDDYAGGKGMTEKAGKACRKLLVEYGVAKTKRLARQKGWRYREERAENGEVKCYVSPPNSWSGSAAATTKSW